MTREEAIKILKKEMEGLVLILEKPLDRNPSGTLEALDMAISALSDYDKMQKISLDLAYENDELINKMNELSADGDCISRKDAIQALKAEGLEDLCRSLGVYPWNVIKMIPSVQPKKEDNTMDIYSDLLRVKHGTMSIDSLIDKVWCGRKVSE